MTELMKLYEADFEKGLTHECYQGWLETEISDNKRYIATLESKVVMYEYEIKQLKGQLTWRPVSEKPEKADMYFAEVNPYAGCDSTIITTAYFDGESFLWHAVVSWLPIPPQGE